MATIAELTAVLEAAEMLLSARADNMLTSEEWSRLQAAAMTARGREPVAEADGCPDCGERDPDNLVWGADEGEDPATVRCAACGIVYTPPSARPGS